MENNRSKKTIETLEAAFLLADFFGQCDSTNLEEMIHEELSVMDYIEDCLINDNFQTLRELVEYAISEMSCEDERMVPALDCWNLLKQWGTEQC